MLMLPPSFNGEKPEKAKTHYERFNQYIKFQTKEGNIKDTTKEAIELFEHTLEEKTYMSCISKTACFLVNCASLFPPIWTERGAEIARNCLVRRSSMIELHPQ